MTNRLDELRGLLDSATPKPWWADGRSVIAGDGDRVALCDGHVLADTEGVADAALIVFLRNHAEDLLAAARCASDVMASAEETGRRHKPIEQWQDGAVYVALHAALARLSPTSEEGS